MKTDELLGAVDEWLADGGEPPDLEALLLEMGQCPEDRLLDWWQSLTEAERAALWAYYETQRDAIRQAGQNVQHLVADAIGPLVDAVMALVRTIVDAFGALVEKVEMALRPHLRWVIRYTEEIQRMVLAYRLRRRLPWAWACWLAAWWPRRWLPALALGPPDQSRSLEPRKASC